MAKKKLCVALVMGGGTSLGAFSGGALSRVIEDLNAVNKRPDGPFDIEIDVVAGASAGSLTLAVALHTLCDPGGGVDEMSKRQFKSWVEMIDIKHLTREPANGTWKSLLNREAVDDIAVKVMKWNDGTTPTPTLLANRVLFTCSMTNLNGIAVDCRKTIKDTVNVIGSDGLADPLTGTWHKDARTFELLFNGTPKTPASRFRALDLSQRISWMEIAGSAVASGAFPFAFEPVPLLRYKKEYDEPLTRQWRDYTDSTVQIEKDNEPMLMSFADGGIMDNEPLEQALTHCRMLDLDKHGILHPNRERLIVYIDPFADGHVHQERLAAHADTALEGRGKNVATAGAMDKIIGQVGATINALRKQSIQRTWIRNPDDKVAAYGKNLTLLGIAPVNIDGSRVSLLGKELSGFKGFLDQKYREHDFACGRSLGGQWLRQYSALQLTPLPPSAIVRPDAIPENAAGFNLLVNRVKVAFADLKTPLALYLPIPIGLIREVATEFKLNKLLKTALADTNPSPAPRIIDFFIVAEHLGLSSLKNPTLQLCGKNGGSDTDEIPALKTASIHRLATLLIAPSTSSPTFSSPNIDVSGDTCRMTIRVHHSRKIPNSASPKTVSFEIPLDLPSSNIAMALSEAISMSCGGVFVYVDLTDRDIPVVKKVVAREMLEPWTIMARKMMP
ncbi:MAG TPA: patatin-like phospholipase family protein [Kiritimatiellia bacterium]|nr:patatin-like phospholipase family protein [Kiritimatiellia bacterium]HMP33647.1 patatin-like phospholipase family protein [Kiritimatiellia bacterium]